MFRRSYFIRKFILAITLFLALSANLEAQVVLVSPASQNVRVGETVTVQVRVENITALKVYSIKVSYDKNLLHCTSISKLDFLNGPFSTFFFQMADSVNGIAQCDEAILGTGSNSGSGGLFEIKFTAKSAGVSPLSFFSLDLRNLDNQQLTYTSTGGSITVQNATGVEGGDPAEINFQLYPNFPNPFNPSTTITFSLSARGFVNLEVFSITGEKAAVLLSEEMPAGNHSVKFESGNLPGGIYICRLTTGNNAKSIKMNLLK